MDHAYMHFPCYHSAALLPPEFRQDYIKGAAASSSRNRRTRTTKPSNRDLTEDPGDQPSLQHSTNQRRASEASPLCQTGRNTIVCFDEPELLTFILKRLLRIEESWTTPIQIRFAVISLFSPWILHLSGKGWKCPKTLTVRRCFC